jgi:hypothetical protein
MVIIQICLRRVVWGETLGVWGYAFVARALPVGVFWPLRWHPRFAFVARAVWFACVCAGIRVTVFAVHASPLCGAAPTFLCRRKEK